jgi:hypothetical protein
MRSSRNRPAVTVMLVMGLVIAGALRAQETPVPAAAPPTVEEQAESVGARPADAEKQAPDEEGDSGAGKPAKEPGVVGPTPNRFEPTEKVRADYDVSFPVDI